MPRLKLLFRCVGEALAAHGLRGLAGLVPFGEVVYDVAGGAFERYRAYRVEEAERADLEEAVQAALEDVKEEALAVAAEVAHDQPEAVRAQLARYLVQVPSLLRQTCKRPADGSGRSVPAALTL